MYIVIHHRIKDANAFWTKVEQAGQATPPAGLKAAAFFPSADDTVAVCLYEASSLERLRDYVDGALGDASENSYFTVNAERAAGLPA